MSILLDKWLIWHKARIVEGIDPNVTRMDDFGNLIDFSAYGTLTERGWEKDHILPKSMGGGDGLFNLRPLHWCRKPSEGRH